MEVNNRIPWVPVRYIHLAELGVALGVLLSIVVSITVGHIGPFFVLIIIGALAVLVYGHICDLQTGVFRWVIPFGCYVTMQSPSRKIHLSLLATIFLEWGLNGFIILGLLVNTPIILIFAALFLIIGAGGSFVLRLVAMLIPDSPPIVK